MIVGISLLLSLVGSHRMELYKMDLLGDISRHTRTQCLEIHNCTKSKLGV